MASLNQLAASQAQPVTTQNVTQVLLQSMQHANVDVRDVALRTLEAWQKASVPGVLTALLEIVRNREGLITDLRVYASIIAKNVVGCTWNRSAVTTFGRTFVEKQEWALIADAEKASLKDHLLTLLFTEPDERIVLQLTLIVSSVARHDFPSGWPHLFHNLLDVQDHSFREKRVALRTMKNILKALKGKKALLSVTEASMLNDRAKLQEFTRRSQQEMKSLLSSVAQSFGSLLQTWRKCFDVFARRADDWMNAGTLANCSLSCIRQIILVLESLDDANEMSQFFSEAAQQANHLKNVGTSLPTAYNPQEEAWNAIANKASVLINKCCIAAVDKHARRFAPMVIPFLQLYVESIMALDYESLKCISQKRLVLMTRFLAKIFHNPAYKRPMVMLPASTNLAGVMHESGKVGQMEALQKANRSIGEFFESPTLSQLVEALITKFLLLTDEELEEWEADPEGYFLASNLDLDIESEVRRCCAEALLLFLMERNVETTSRVVLTLASQAVQNTQDYTSLRLAEACFHAIDATATLIPLGTLDYDAFFSSDLAKYLDMPSNDILCRVMQARVLHLLVTFSPELSSESYEKALMASLKFLQSPDIVLALYSVKLLHKLCLADIVGRGAYAEVHSRLLRAQAALVMSSSFQLASKLQDGETLQMVLKLIAIEVEAFTDENSSHIVQILAENVPRLWQFILSLSQKEAGFGAPCQSSLINILLLLIEKVGDACLVVAQLKEVIFQLIGFCVNGGAEDPDYLLEDGLKLWRTVLLYGSWESVGDSVHSSVENLMRIIQSGKENHEALCILKVHVIMCGPQIMAEHEPLIKLLIDHCLSDNGTVKEAYAALDFLYTLTLVDPDLSYRISRQALGNLVHKYACKEGNNEVTRSLLDPLLSVLALLVVWNESVLNVFVGGVVEELIKILLSFKGLRSVHEFLAVPGARAMGRIKRKVAIILLGFIVKYFPDLGKKYKKHILHFGVTQVQEESVQRPSVEDLLDARGGLTQPSKADVWKRSHYYEKSYDLVARDPICNFKLREFLDLFLEYLTAGDRENSVEALLTNMSLASSQQE